MNSKLNNRRHLLIGPVPPPIGGTTVLFKCLLDDLKTLDVDFDLLNTSSSGIFSKLKLSLKVICKVLFWHGRGAVIFNCSNTPFFYLSPLLYIICRLRGLKLIIRKFGGNLITSYESLNFLHRLLLKHTTLKTDIIFVETKFILNSLAPLCTRTEWWPNCRRLSLYKKKEDFSKGSLRCIFVGLVTPDKGIDELIEAFSSHVLKSELLIVGPASPAYPIYDKISDKKNIKYIGSTEPQNLPSILYTADVLILPTKHFGEGYPGVIIEAFASGVPVISTNWFAISELVDSSRGILIDTCDSRHITTAVKFYEDNPDVLRAHGQNAHEYSQKFDSINHTKKMLRLVDFILD